MMTHRFWRGAACAALLPAFLIAAEFKAPLAPGRAPAYRRHGPADARVLMVVFSDYQCPGCARAHQHVKSLEERFAGQMQVVHRHFPLQMHAWAWAAARAADAAGRQGKFEPYQDMLFERQKEWSSSPDPRPAFRQYAEFLKLDLGAFQKDVESTALDGVIEKDRADGRALNITMTPTVFMNGRRYVGETQIRKIGSASAAPVLEP
jgi:protein-disulfide isomerase